MTPLQKERRAERRRQWDRIDKGCCLGLKGNAFPRDRSERLAKANEWRALYPDQIKQRLEQIHSAKIEHKRILHRKRSKENCSSITDAYVRQLLRYFGIKKPNSELIVLKRRELLTSRFTRQLKKEILHGNVD